MQAMMAAGQRCQAMNPDPPLFEEFDSQDSKFAAAGYSPVEKHVRKDSLLSQMY